MQRFPSFEKLLLIFPILSTEKKDGSLNVCVLPQSHQADHSDGVDSTPRRTHIFLSTARHSSHRTMAHVSSFVHVCVPQKDSSSLCLMSFLGSHILPLHFCSTPRPPSSIAHPLLRRSGISLSTGNATLRACGSSVRVADNALLTGYEPNKTDSMFCIDVSSDCTPINIVVRRENIDIENDFKIRCIRGLGPLSSRSS